MANLEEKANEEEKKKATTPPRTKMLLDRELSWPQLAAASVSAVMLPLILHRIFFHKKAHRHSSLASSGSLDDYITKVRTLGDWMATPHVAVTRPNTLLAATCVFAV